MKDKIENFLDKYYPNDLRFYPASAAPYVPPAAAPAAAPAPLTYVQPVINNSVILTPAPAAPAPAAREGRKPSSGQIVVAAGILTAGAVALSYFWHEGDHLHEMIQLKEELEGAVLEANAEDGLIYNNMIRFLDLEIGFAKKSRIAKLLGTASLSVTAAGIAIATDFLLSLGWVGLAIGCGSFVVWADNHFGWKHSAAKRNDLIKAIRSALNPPGQAYKPSAPE